MFKLTLAVIIGATLLGLGFAQNTAVGYHLPETAIESDSGGMIKATFWHLSAEPAESMGFVKHWWNVSCTVTDRKERGGSFERTFRVCANYATTARMAANRECENQYKQQYGFNCCTCKGKPQDTGSSCE